MNTRPNAQIENGPTKNREPGPTVPAHIKESTGMFCSREGQAGERCPDGCDHADHYSNDGHPECEDLPPVMRP